jgi:hypothetical protein
MEITPQTVNKTAGFAGVARLLATPTIRRFQEELGTL